MLRLIHCSDLHLSDRERDYSLNVFREIVELADKHDVAAILIAGDLFDTFADAEALRADVRELCAPFRGEILYIPGNHEELQSGRRKAAGSTAASPGGNPNASPMQVLDLSPITVVAHTPCMYLERIYADIPVEILAIPHQLEYGDYRGWNVPARRAALRIAMAHGIVTGLAYTGPDEESGAGMLDPMLFAYHQVDYAALGHIHARRLERQGPTAFCYPGSARVWRRGESGERGVALVRFDPGTSSIQTDFVRLESAGTYREVPVPLSLNAESAELRDTDSWQPEDYVELRLTGLIEDERVIADLVAGLRQRYGDRVRRFEIRRDDVDVLPGISSEPIVRKFLELWERHEPATGAPDSADRRRADAIWLRSREIALTEIKRVLDSKR